MNTFLTLSNQSYLAAAVNRLLWRLNSQQTRLTCAVVQSGFNNMLMFKNTFLIMEMLRYCNNKCRFLELLQKSWLKGAIIGLQRGRFQCCYIHLAKTEAVNLKEFRHYNCALIFQYRFSQFNQLQQSKKRRSILM